MKTSFLQITLILAVFALAASGPLFGQKLPSNPTLSLPEPVEVMGAVEVIGEAYKKPFVLSRSGVLNGGQSSGYVQLELPAGKRIVIESVTAIAEAAVGSKPRGILYLDSSLPAVSDGALPIGLTDEGPWSGRVVWYATSAAKIRLDTDVHQLAFSFRRTGTSYATFDVTIFGYVEEL